MKHDPRSLDSTMVINIAAGRDADASDLRLRILKTLGSFRVLIAAGLLVVFFAGGDPYIFGARSPQAFAVLVAIYLAWAVFLVWALYRRWWSLNVYAAAPVPLDIAVTIAIMHMSGGIGSGLGGLLIVYVGVSSLTLPGSWAAVFAALATFFILGEQAYSWLRFDDANFPAAGLLAAIVFMMAVAAQGFTRRLQASEALARQRGVDLKNLSELNDYIVQHLRESILVLDENNRVRLGNTSAARLLGAAGSMSGRPLDTISDALAGYIARWRQDPDLSSHANLQLGGPDAGVRIVAHVATLAGDGGRSGAIMIFLEDASLMNERVQQSKLASLGRLSASIAHEIRNPVGAMSHAAQLLAESDRLSDEERRLTDIIESNSERVSLIIDNMLQLSRRESGRPELLYLADWVNEFADEFSRTLELKEGEVQVDNVDADMQVRVDRSHLRQVMWNLCDNAVKYASETGGILIEIHAGRLEGRDRPYLEVRDHGLGIEAGMADKIFEPFYTARKGGTGLGLFISRELCELNGANLSYLDREGGGSIFRIVFSDPERWTTQDMA